MHIHTFIYTHIHTYNKHINICTYIHTTAAFIKYAGQCRIGRMDGAFVTYHNTQEIFGFQYVPLATMDQLVSSAYIACIYACMDLCIYTDMYVCVCMCACQ